MDPPQRRNVRKFSCYASGRFDGHKDYKPPNRPRSLHKGKLSLWLHSYTWLCLLSAGDRPAIVRNSHKDMDRPQAQVEAGIQRPAQIREPEDLSLLVQTLNSRCVSLFPGPDSPGSSAPAPSSKK